MLFLLFSFCHIFFLPQALALLYLILEVGVCIDPQVIG